MNFDFVDLMSEFIVLNMDLYRITDVSEKTKSNSRFYNSNISFSLMFLYCLYYQDHNGKAAYSPFLPNKSKHIPKHIKESLSLGNAASRSLDEVTRVENNQRKCHNAFEKAD